LPAADALEEAERLLRKATAAPWKVYRNGPGCRGMGRKTGPKRQEQHEEVAYTSGLSDDDSDRANAALICLLRNRAPGWIAELRAAREVVDAYRDLHAYAKASALAARDFSKSPPSPATLGRLAAKVTPALRRYAEAREGKR
jgi:hypothetical protein